MSHVPSRAFERFSDGALWAMYWVLHKPQSRCASYTDDIFSEVLMELHRRGQLEGKRPDEPIR